MTPEQFTELMAALGWIQALLAVMAGILLGSTITSWP